jgi:hypothetical protein
LAQLALENVTLARVQSFLTSLPQDQWYYALNHQPTKGNMKRKLVLACMSVGLILAAAQPVSAQATNPPSLAGSWQLTLIPASPPASSPPVAPVSGLATFTAGGSVVETDATEVVPMMIAPGSTVYGTPGHGIWQPGPAVGNLFIQFISLLVDHNATLHAKKIVTITGALDSTGKQFSGNYSFRLVDPTGHVITMGSGTVTGQRIPHPLLP